MLSDLRVRLRSLFRRRTVERELDDELQFHVERQAERYQRAGLTADEASRRARLDLGTIEPLKEACRDERGVGTLERLAQDVRFAAREVQKRPAFAAAVIVTFGLGVGATTTMFSVVHGILLRPLAYPGAERLVQIGSTFGSVQVAAVSAPDALDLAARTKTMAAVAMARAQPVDLTGAGDPERLIAASVSASFFDVLGVHPELGRGLSTDHDRPGSETVVILSRRLWQRRFGGDRAVLGHSLVLNGAPHTVIGVMPAGFAGPAAIDLQDADLWLPLGRLGDLLRNRDDASVSTIAKLSEGADLVAARAELDNLARAIALAQPGRDGRRLWANPLHAQTVGDSGRLLWLLFGAVTLVLLIACANVANLFLVRATERTREMAIRVALGAGRARIARQLLTESALFALSGGALGVALAYAGVALFRAAGPADLPRVADVAIDARVLAFAFGVSAVAGIACGLVPALDLLRPAPGDRLRHQTAQTTATRPRLRLRYGLVVLQTAVALVLLAGAGLMAHSLVRLSFVDPGFQSGNVVWIDLTLPERNYAGAAPKLAFFDSILTHVRAMPGVEQAGGIQGRPLESGNAVATMAPESRPPADAGNAPRFPYHGTTPGYFDTLGIPRLDGRDFGPDDVATAPRVAIVSRAFAERFWPGERVVGQRFWMGRVAPDAPLTTVVGVVEDVRQYGLAASPQPIVYRPVAQVPRGRLGLVVRHDGRAAAGVVLRDLRQVIRRLDRALPLDRAGTMDEQVRASLGEPRFRALALSIFSVTATALALVGLYGTLAWIVRARRRELGIRAALGASAGDLCRLVVGRGMVLTAIGIVLGLAGALAASRLLAQMVFGITPTDAATFASVAAGMALVSLAASWLPARRAAGIDPVRVLREE
jgi:putative ABC transport system permease protein